MMLRKIIKKSIIQPKTTVSMGLFQSLMTLRIAQNNYLVRNLINFLTEMQKTRSFIKRVKNKLGMKNGLKDNLGKVN